MSLQPNLPAACVSLKDVSRSNSRPQGAFGSSSDRLHIMHMQDNQNPVTPAHLSSQEHWSPQIGAANQETPFEGQPHHGYGNPFADPGLASERGTIKSTYTSDTMRSNMSTGTFPSLPLGNPRQRPKLESHLADLRCAAGAHCPLSPVDIDSYLAFVSPLIKRSDPTNCWILNIYL